MNKLLWLLILPFAFSAVSGQNNPNIKIRQYLRLKEEIERTPIEKMTDIDNLLGRVKTVVDSVELKGIDSFEFFFSKQGINFYQYQSYMTVDGNGVSIVGVDTAGNAIIVVDDPIKVINELLEKTNRCDSATFLEYVEIFNKLNFRNGDIQFLEKFDPNLFKSSLYFEQFNHVTIDEYKDIHLRKIFREEVMDVIEVNTINYSYEHGKFVVAINLKYRIPN